ncbi:MAG: hypothetical protein E4H17_04545, partial [Gemmatimonadales bacterium]
MTEQHDNAPSASRLAGKWQMPLFALSVVALAITAWLAWSSAPQVPWEERLAEVQALTESAEKGDYSVALDEAAKLLEATPQEQRERRAMVWAQLAEIQWRIIEHSEGGDSARWLALRDHYLQARRAGLKLTAEMAERLGRAHEALAEVDEAISQYQLTSRLDPDRSGRLGRRIIELSGAGRGLPQAELLKRLEAYLQTKDLDDRQYAWALGRAVGLLIDRGELERARLFVERQQSTARSRTGERELQFQLARVLKALGSTPQAEDQLIEVIEALDREPSTSDLALRSRLLYGQLIWRDNPQDAATAFEAVASSQPDGPMVAAALLGLAQAYGKLRLHEESLAKYELAIQTFRRHPETPYVSLSDIRQAMADGRKEIQAANRPEMALRFLQAERWVFDMDASAVSTSDWLSLLDRLAKARLAAAEKAERDQQAAAAAKAGPDQLAGLRRLHRENLRLAGELYLERAALAVKDHDKIYGQSLWQAAEAFDQGGMGARNVDTLKKFVTDRPTDPRVPETRFRLGQALQAADRYDEAIEVYKANLAHSVPAGRHPQALAGLIPLAECYIAKGEKFHGEAEKVL